MSCKKQKNKTRLEKLIISIWYETDKGKKIYTERQLSVVSAIKSTLKYYDMYDYLNNFNHVNIIETIYLNLSVSDKNKAIKSKTMAGFAKALYIGENTLSRYTDKYIKCFEKYLKDITEFI